MGDPKGMVVMHICDNKLCVNPDHLRIGTVADNNKDKALKGRSTSGQKNPKAKLTEQEAREVFEAEGIQREIANKYKVSQQTVSYIKQGGWGCLGLVNAK
jgi:DNA-directed RNA polymerase specialized sigma subunit